MKIKTNAGLSQTTTGVDIFCRMQSDVRIERKRLKEEWGVEIFYGTDVSTEHFYSLSPVLLLSQVEAEAVDSNRFRFHPKGLFIGAICG